jgi:hypothetical protein
MTELPNSVKYFNNLEKRARYKLIKRYDKPLSYHDVKIINDILYNEKTHYVEAFKEYLIYEDYNEFLKRFYKTSDLNIKLPKILIFYEKYSKIYANYTVIPESKYMYKNIKRKQKMIDQMQNNGNNESEVEEEEESNEEMSNTVFSSKIMNSIYRKTLSTLNKSDNGNSEQSINDFVNKINNIENKVSNNCLKNNFIKNTNKYIKSQKEMFLPMKKLHKEFLTHKNTPKSTKINIYNKNEQNLNNKYNNQKNKFINIQFTYSKKNLQNELLPKNKTNNNLNSNNLNVNTNTNVNSNGNILNKNNSNSNNIKSDEIKLSVLKQNTILLKRFNSFFKAMIVFLQKSFGRFKIKMPYEIKNNKIKYKNNIEYSCELDKELNDQIALNNFTKGLHLLNINYIYLMENIFGDSLKLKNWFDISTFLSDKDDDLGSVERILEESKNDKNEEEYNGFIILED